MKCQQCDAPLQEGVPYCDACGAKIVKNAPNDPLLGRIFSNQFILTKKLGIGGFGSVYEANQPSVSRKAAVKILHPHLAHQPEIAIRFRREGLAASKLTHPAVVKVYAFGETEDEIIWIAMEFLEGDTLSARLRRQGALSSQELIHVLGPICEALQEAHQKGIVHRDLKPDNIMLTKGPTGEPTPKLLDFGVASLVSDLQVTQSGAMSGSPPYMPPEQWKGLKYTDARSDIYALGVVAYQCLTNRLPFDADTAPAWMQKHCTEPPLDMAQFVSNEIPRATQSVILKALLKEPNDRFQTTMEFKKALEDAERGISQTLPPSLTLTQPSISMPSRPTQKAPRFYLGLGLGILVAGVLAFLLQYFLVSPSVAVVPPPAMLSASAPVAAPASIPTKIALVTTAPDVSPEEPASAPTKTPDKKLPKKTTTPTKTTPEPETPPVPAPNSERSDSEVQRLVQDKVGRMKLSGCNNPNAQFYASVILTIESDGVVSDTYPNNPEPQSECLADKLLGMSFQKENNGKKQRLGVSVWLKNRMD